MFGLFGAVKRGIINLILHIMCNSNNILPFALNVAFFLNRSRCTFAKLNPPVITRTTAGVLCVQAGRSLFMTRAGTLDRRESRCTNAMKDCNKCKWRNWVRPVMRYEIRWKMCLLFRKSKFIGTCSRPPDGRKINCYIWTNMSSFGKMNSYQNWATCLWMVHDFPKNKAIFHY